jgi:DNA polymerase
LVQQLEGWQASGVTHVAKRRTLVVPPAGGNRSSIPPEGGTANRPPEGGTTNVPSEDRVAALEVIQREVAACTRCKLLAATRTQTVFGVGNPQARLCFVGEAPGADEDAQGVPFVGRAGQLLTKIIEACTLKREDVYILNVLKCRPPDNRTPEEDEVANCRGYLEQQLKIIRPEFICCLGAVAARTLLDSTQSIGRLRGKFHDYRGIPVLCTYHPSYLLRNPAAKRDVWEDMKVLLKRMGVELS